VAILQESIGIQHSIFSKVLEMEVGGEVSLYRG